jgi:4-hydroxy-3-polyprenylbenzoate decarboxylase
MTEVPSDAVVVGMTGASGAPIAVAVVRALHAAGVPVHLIASEAGQVVLREECQLTIDDLRAQVTTVLGEKEFTARVASGSTPTRGMVIVPCSSNTLAKLAHGMADTLITRAAHVHLKERRPLILVPRETPLSVFTLRNMTALTEAGATMLIASPPYYLRAKTVDELVGYLAGKVLDHLHVPHTLYRGWRSDEGSV